MSIVVLMLLFVSIVSGGYNTIVARYHMLDTIAPWLQSVFYLNPKPELIRNIPITYQIHIMSAFAIFGLYPFTLLVHMISVPIPYLARRYIVYRRREPQKGATA